MVCSLKAIVGCGIFLAIIDILHGLVTLGFYGYRFVSNYFYLCPRELDITVCQNKIYVYDQMFTLRTYIGLGEGAITPLFDIIYIIALIKHKPWLTWFWLLKSFGVMGINVFYISSWLVRRKSFAHISFDEDSKHYEQLFRLTGIGLTLAQLAITVIFCIIAGIFTYKVAEERTRSRKSLHHGAKFRSKKHHSSSAPPLDSYDADDSASIVRVTMDEQFMNQGLHDSTNKLPISGSNGSIDQVGNSDTIRQPTSV